MASGYTAIYGLTRIPKATCLACNTISFIENGRYKCCDSIFLGTIQGYKYEIESKHKRKLPSKEEQETLLAQFNNTCLYCSGIIGSYCKYNNRLIMLRLAWDHFIPYSYLQDNPNNNWVLSCHICNGIKSNKIFKTLNEAKDYINEKRKLRVRSVRPLPSAVQKEKSKAKVLHSKLQRVRMARKESTHKCNECGLEIALQFKTCWTCQKKSKSTDEAYERLIAEVRKDIEDTYTEAVGWRT